MRVHDEDSTIVDRSPDTRSPARRSISSVHEPIDPRISPAARSPDAVLDEGYFHQLGDHIHRHEAETKSEKQQQETQSEDIADETIYVCYMISNFFSTMNRFPHNRLNLKTRIRGIP